MGHPPVRAKRASASPGRLPFCRRRRASTSSRVKARAEAGVTSRSPLRTSSSKGSGRARPARQTAKDRGRRFRNRRRSRIVFGSARQWRSSSTSRRVLSPSRTTRSRASKRSSSEKGPSRRARAARRRFRRWAKARARRSPETSRGSWSWCSSRVSHPTPLRRPWSHWARATVFPNPPGAPTNSPGTPRRRASSHRFRRAPRYRGFAPVRGGEQSSFCLIGSLRFLGLRASVFRSLGKGKKNPLCGVPGLTSGHGQGTQVPFITGT